MGGFNAFFARAYGLPGTIQQTYGSAFDPFLNDQNFFLSVVTLEELGATGLVKFSPSSFALLYILHFQIHTSRGIIWKHLTNHPQIVIESCEILVDRLYSLYRTVLPLFCILSWILSISYVNPHHHHYIKKADKRLALGNKGLAGLASNPVLANGIAGLATSATAQATIERFVLWTLRDAVSHPFSLLCLAVGLLSLNSLKWKGGKTPCTDTGLSVLTSNFLTHSQYMLRLFCFHDSCSALESK